MKIKQRDLIKIPGDYQYNAITKGFVIQRFWHYTKILAIKKYLPPKSSDLILDVGCGSGIISSFLSKSGAHVIGIDENDDAISFATKKFASDNVSFLKGLIDNEEIYNNQVDKIYCLEVIEHVYINQAEKMLSSFNNILKSKGQVFLTTPNYKSLWPFIEWILDHAKLAPHMASDQHVEFYNSRKLLLLCKSMGFNIKIFSTMCHISPLVSIINWKIAEKFFNIEVSLPLGPILLVVLEKNGVGMS